MTTSRCPSCGAFSSAKVRSCVSCGYRGDFIQPGHEHLSACEEYRGVAGTERCYRATTSCYCVELAGSVAGRLRLLRGGAP
jgi:hypothetical protein